MLQAADVVFSFLAFACFGLHLAGLSTAEWWNLTDEFPNGTVVSTSFGIWWTRTCKDNACSLSSRDLSGELGWYSVNSTFFQNRTKSVEPLQLQWIKELKTFIVKKGLKIRLFYGDILERQYLRRVWFFVVVIYIFFLINKLRRFGAETFGSTWSKVISHNLFVKTI